MADILKLADEYVEYAKENLELKKEDMGFKRNRVLEILESGLDGDDLADAVFGELSLLPSELNARFGQILKENGSKAATDWFYDYCVKNHYVKKSVLDKNLRFQASNGLIVTINKAKPEFKDPETAIKGNSVEEGFCKCVICRENEGYGARGKRNLRTVSLTLCSQSWFWQYSPYGYLKEHGIIVNSSHTPMRIDRDTFLLLMDFVDKYPHYFAGCNAPLPGIGGSVLSHDHYQGGGEILPLHRAKIKRQIRDEKYPYVLAGILDWPGTVIRIKSDKRNEVAEVAERIRKAWINYDNPALGIIARDKDGGHNAVSPTVIKTVNGYEMNVILRSNITSERYPDGVFHAHPEYHSVKKESIGLIEAQGLFILPGRLEAQLAKVEEYVLKGRLTEELEEFKHVFDEVKKLSYKTDVHTAMREALGIICYKILENTAVFKREKDLFEFLKSAGFDI